MSAPAIKRLVQWQDAEYVRSQAEQAGVSNIQTKVLEWGVPQENAQAFVDMFAPLIPGIVGVGDDQSRRENLDRALVKVLVDKYGADKPFSLNVATACFVGTK